MSQRTLSIIKPDGVARRLIGEIYKRFEAAGLTIIGARMLHLDEQQARDFYRVHGERPFYEDLVAYMTSGPIMVQVLAGENAIDRNRELMGATNPDDAAEGTVRADYGESVGAQCCSRVRRSGDGQGRNRLFLPARRSAPALTRHS